MAPDVDDLDVPLAWLAAEHAAEQLISDRYPHLSPALFDYRAVQYVLALTIFLSEESAPADRPALLRDRTRSAASWELWCRDRLRRPDAGPDASHRMAQSAWRWLRGGVLLLDTDCATECGPGLSLGVDLAHRALGQQFLR